MKYLIFILSLVTICGCTKKEIGPQHVNEPLFAGQKVLVLNEGNFGWGNASISAYNPNQNRVANGIFSSVNNLPLGDVCQSGIRWNNSYLIVVNNSNRIEILDSANLESIEQIECMGSPRYLLPAKNERVYVSDLYRGQLGIVNLANYQLVDSIAVPGWVENLIYANEFLYATCPNDESVICIDTTINTVIQSIDVGIVATSIVKDRNNQLWVLGLGSGAASAHLLCINPSTNTIISNFEFPEFEAPAQLVINGVGEELYYLNNGICRMHITDNELPSNKLINGYGQNNYGLSINPITNEIYLTDAKDFIQPGSLFRFSQLGQLIDSVDCGIIPQSIIF
ncbi:hypothetical protein N9M27_03115 [Flavobacteriales bacterium]|nr:hypothetical protein [Flavobacteriales bacterium]